MTGGANTVGPAPIVERAMMLRPALRLGVAALALGLTGCAGTIRDRIYHPTALPSTMPAWISTAPQSVEAVTADGLTLAGYYWPPASPDKGIIVYFHGNGHNQLVGATRAEPLHLGGTGLLIASYRGYGGNPGKPSENGLIRDGDAWMMRAPQLVPGAPVYVFGHSLGGGVAMQMGARHPVAGVLTLGTFTSLKDMAPGLARPIMPDRFDNRATIAKVSAPVILAHGTVDDTIPYAMAGQLKAAARPGGAHILTLTGIGHTPTPEQMRTLAPGFVELLTLGAGGDMEWSLLAP